MTDRDAEIISEVFRVIEERKRGGVNPNSYVSTLIFGRGLEGVVAKIEEEADELILAARGETDQRVVEEAADLIFHTLILLVTRGISVEEVYGELRRRRR